MKNARKAFFNGLLSHLAKNATAPQTTEHIATAIGLPPATLAKILQALSHAGIVRTQRGIGGGVELALPPSGITVRQVINALDVAVLWDAFDLKVPGGCLHRRLRLVGDLLEMVLHETTIAELAEGGRSAQAELAYVDSVLERLADVAGLVTRKHGH